MNSAYGGKKLYDIRAIMYKLNFINSSDTYLLFNVDNIKKKISVEWIF